MKFGAQLYGARDFAETDLDFTFYRLDEIGYSSVEFNSFYDYSPEYIKEVLEKYSLTADAVHIDQRLLRENAQELIAKANAIGVKDIVIPTGIPGEDDWVDKIIETYEMAKAICDPLGIQLHYHTHDFDYKPIKYIEKYLGQRPIDIIVEKTDLMIEPDIYWIWKRDINASQEIKRFFDMGRIKFVHLKDGTMDDTTALGYGDVPVLESVDVAKELGLRCIIESDDLIPDGISEMKKSFKYLKKLEYTDVKPQ